MKLESPVFKHTGFIPRKYTCDSEDINPPLKILDVPANTKSFALIIDDPDAPRGTFVHWVIWNISSDTKEISENALLDAVHGINDFGRLSYGGPCPPKGPSHTYCFKLYALDSKLNLKEGSTKEELERAMEGHIIEFVELDGEYQRS